MTRVKQIAIYWLCVAAAFVPIARGGDNTAPPTPSESISLGLAFLFQQQNFDGSFGPRQRRAGMTGLALLAYLATANTDDGGRYAANIRRAIEYLTRESTVESALIEDRALVTLALCEAYGVETDEILRDRINNYAQRSVKSLLAQQRVNKPGASDGGWCAQPNDAKSDPQAGEWSAMALEAAARAGMAVPKENLDRARAYVAQLSKAPATITTRPVSSLDGRVYFDTLRIFSTQPANVQPLIDALIHDQLADGSWNSSASRDTGGDVRATSIAILTIAMPLGLEPHGP